MAFGLSRRVYENATRCEGIPIRDRGSMSGPRFFYVLCVSGSRTHVRETPFMGAAWLFESNRRMPPQLCEVPGVLTGFEIKLSGLRRKCRPDGCVSGLHVASTGEQRRTQRNEAPCPSDCVSASPRVKLDRPVGLTGRGETKSSCLHPSFHWVTFCLLLSEEDE